MFANSFCEKEVFWYHVGVGKYGLLNVFISVVFGNYGFQFLIFFRLFF